MKGIIVEYNEDRGFGFIKDQQETKHFFHISWIKNKNAFLDNKEDYCFTDWLERKCYVVTFIPFVDETGRPQAKDIILTQQVFNDKSNVSPFDPVVTDVEYFVNSLTRIVTGIKGGSVLPFATAGGHGTYRIGYPETYKALNISFRRTDDIGWGKFDVRDLTLRLNGRTKITDAFVERIRQRLLGKTIRLIPVGDTWQLVDNSILVL